MCVYTEEYLDAIVLCARDASFKIESSTFGDCFLMTDARYDVGMLSNATIFHYCYRRRKNETHSVLLCTTCSRLSGFKEKKNNNSRSFQYILDEVFYCNTTCLIPTSFQHVVVDIFIFTSIFPCPIFITLDFLIFRTLLFLVFRSFL